MRFTSSALRGSGIHYENPISDKLTHQDRVVIQNALRRTPQLATVPSRIALVRNVLGGRDIENALDWVQWDASAFVVASQLVDALEQQEQAPGVPALAVLVQTIEPMVNAEHRAALADLRRRLKWGNADPLSLAAAWREQREPAQVVQERIIGENTLRPLYYLRRALFAADAVVRVDQHGVAKGTGFLLAPNLMATNNHVIADEAAARNSQAVFFDEVADQREPAPGRRQPVPVEVAALLYTNALLDISLVRLNPATAPALTHYLPLRRSARLKPRDRVVIIQHPGGLPKQISLQNNLVAYADERIVQYYTSTKAGSSGSPVLDEEFAVAAIHHGWVHNAAWDKVGEDQIRHDAGDSKQMEDLQYRNQGTTAAALLADLATQAPHLLGELNVLPD